jgi:hypothetical protein
MSKPGGVWAANPPPLPHWESGGTGVHRWQGGGTLRNQALQEHSPASRAQHDGGGASCHCRCWVQHRRQHPQSCGACTVTAAPGVAPRVRRDASMAVASRPLIRKARFVVAGHCRYATAMRGHARLTVPEPSGNSP